MKSNELRLGNFVTYENVLHVVRVLYPNQVRISPVAPLVLSDIPRDVYETEYSELSGIPLTPERLEKCGLIRENMAKMAGSEMWCYTIRELVFRFRTDGFYLINSVLRLKNISSKIEYLHQLQNLIFDLTGTELEYKS